ncbi:hypothetical protein BsWGS_01530 [Bradybaena similaris]
MEDVVLVNLLFFAKGKEIVGQKQAQLYLPQKTTGKNILESILNEFPELELIANNVVLSLNEEYLDNSTEVNLKAGDEVAVIPPISGG